MGFWSSVGALSSIGSASSSAIGAVSSDLLQLWPQLESGMTRAELKEIFDASGKDKKALDAYTNNPDNWFCQEDDLPPLMTAGGDDLLALSLPELESRLRDAEDAQAELKHYRAELEQHRATLKERIGDHLWIPADFSEPAAAQLTQKLHETDALLERLEVLLDILGIHQRVAALKR